MSLCIDIHTHILPPPEVWPDLSAKFGYAGFIGLEKIQRDGAAGCCCARMVRTERDKTKTFFREIEPNCWDPAARIADMGRWESDHLNAVANPRAVQVLSTVPVMFGYWAKPQDTLELSRWLNDHLAEVCRAHPSRFTALGTIPMNAPKLAIQELERCVRDLNMPGVQIGSNVNGVNLGEPEFFDVFAAAQELGACVFVHPWDMLCDPVLAAGANGPFPPELNPRLRRHWLAWLVGMPAETALAVCSMLFSGIFDKLPRLRVAFAHGGGSFPGTIGRIDHGFHARPDLCQTHTTTSPRSHIQHPARFYVDSLVHDAGALRSLLDLLGANRIMLGSDYPFPLGEERPGELILHTPGIPPADRNRLLHATALEFLGPAAGHFVTKQ